MNTSESMPLMSESPPDELDTPETWKEWWSNQRNRAAFNAIVMSERIRRGWRTLTHNMWCWSVPSRSQVTRRGRSAPVLSDAPKPQARPLETRITLAQLWPVDGIPIDCTEYLKSFIMRCNRLDRPDIFEAALCDFLPQAGVEDAKEDDVLYVCYKRGMRVFSVVYRETIVFPPAVMTTDRRAPIKRAVMGDDTDVTAIARQFAGPDGDFYAGSCYVSRAKWIAATSGLEATSPTLLTLTYDNGESRVFDTTSDVQLDDPYVTGPSK